MRLSTGKTWPPSDGGHSSSWTNLSTLRLSASHLDGPQNHAAVSVGRSGPRSDVGLSRDGGLDQLTDEAVGLVCELVRPARRDGRARPG